MRRLGRTIVHNWPLKLGAIALATILYAGLVASQDSDTYVGPITVTPVNQPADTVITNQLRDVGEVRYIAPADLGRLQAEDFRATVDLSNIPPDIKPVAVPVQLTAIDPRVTILDVQPKSINVVLDELVTRTVDVIVVQAASPAGVEVGEVTVTPATVQVSGASAAVKRVVNARVSASIDASALDVDRDIAPEAVDASGETVSGVDIEPPLVHVSIPVYTDKQSRTVPVNPIVTGTPGSGFRVASVDVDPLVVSIEGDKDQISELAAADTAPVLVSGATRDVTRQVPFALPSGVTTIGARTATVTVHIEAVTETRTFLAGVRMDGRRPDLQYEASERSVLLTLFGSTAVLDRLAASPIVIALNVAALEPGTHEVPVVPSLSSTVSVAAVSPETVTVLVTERPSPGPSGSPVGLLGPTPSISP